MRIGLALLTFWTCGTYSLLYRNMKFLELTSSQAPDINSYGTSQGQLASGIVSINGNLVSLQNQANANARITDQELDSEVDFAAQSTLALLNSELLNRQDDLRDVRTRIDYITTVFSAANSTCQGFGDCEDCTSNDSCVWCTAQALCVAGDSFGALYGECLDYEHGECTRGCGQYSICSSCASDNQCGWCASNTVCWPLSQSGDCDQADWYVLDLSSNATCAGEILGASDTYIPSSGPQNTDLSDLQRELDGDQQRAIDLQQAISDLQSQLRSVNNGMNSIDSEDIPAVQVQNNLAALPTLVDATAQREAEDRLNQTRAFATLVGQQVSQAAVDSVTQSNNARIQLEDTFASTISNNSQQIIAQTAAQAQNLQQQETQGQTLQQQSQALQTQLTAVSTPATEAPSTQTSIANVTEPEASEIVSSADNSTSVESSITEQGPTTAEEPIEASDEGTTEPSTPSVDTAVSSDLDETTAVPSDEGAEASAGETTTVSSDEEVPAVPSDLDETTTDASSSV